MDALEKVTGVWKGTYRFDSSDLCPRLDSVEFTLTLKQGWFGRFTGSVTDDGSGGMPGTGVIGGHFSFPRIEFTKRMPVGYTFTPDGQLITLREWLAEQGIDCKRELPHPPISYEGEFSSPSRAQGTWLIKAGPVFVGAFRVAQFQEARGSWSLYAS